VETEALRYWFGETGEVGDLGSKPDQSASGLPPVHATCSMALTLETPPITGVGGRNGDGWLAVCWLPTLAAWRAWVRAAMRSGVAGFAVALDMMTEEVVYDESDDQVSEMSRASSKVKAELGVPSKGLDPELFPRSGVLLSMLLQRKWGVPQRKRERVRLTWAQ
jgi:hypothetical protein